MKSKLVHPILRSIILLAFASSSLAGYSQPAWRWKNPLPSGNPLSDITRLDSSHLIAVGMMGTILRSDDKGGSWYRSDSSTLFNLTRVCFTDANYGWIAGEGGVVLHTTDGGFNWKQQISGTTSNFTDIVFPVRDTGFIIGTDNTFLKTTNGGNSWIPVSTIIPGNYFSFSFPDARNGWIVAGDNNLIHTADGGNSWNLVHPVNQPPIDLNLHNVFFQSKDTGWLTGTTAYDSPIPILKTLDGGQSWQQQQFDFFPMCSCYQSTDISFSDANHGWISGILFDSALGIIFETDDGGLTWYQNNVSPYPISGIQKLENGSGLAVGPGHYLYTQYQYYDWISYSFILKTADNFQTWNSELKGITDPSINCFSQISFPEPATGYLRSNNMVFKSTDYGRNWGKILDKPEFIPSDFSFTDALHGVVVGASPDDSAIAITSDGGATWQHLYSAMGESTWLSSVSFIDVLHGWIIGTTYPEETFILRTDNGGLSWNKIFSEIGAPEVSNLHFTDPQNGLYLKGLTILMHSSDGGFNWNEQINIGAYSREQDLCFSDPLHGWIATGDKLLKSSDGGILWKLVPVNESFGFESVFFSDSLNGWTAENTGRIFRTGDGGDSWIEQEHIAIYPVKDLFCSGGDECWAVGKGGMILHFDNGPVSILGLTQAPREAMLNVSPNPFNAETLVTFKIPHSGPVSLDLIDMNGKLLHHIELGIKPAGEGMYRFVNTGIGAGNYILRMNAEAGDQIHSGHHVSCTRVEIY